MTKAKSQRPRSKAVKHAGSKEVVEKKSDKQLSLRSEDLLGNTAKIMRLPRQMIRVQRSEPSEGIIRNELRYVSYSAKDDSGKNPAEIHVVSEAFSALLSRLRELNIILPEVEDNASRFGIDKGAGNEEVCTLRQKLSAKSDKQLSLRSEDLLGNTAKIMRLPRQMIRVQRSEPSEGIIRNELRFVSYSAKDDSGKNPAEIHVVSEAFGALLSRLRELNIILPEVEDNAGRFGIDQAASNEEVCTLRQKLSASEEECERLRKNIEEIRNAFEYESDRTSVTSLAEPEWVKETEAKIKAVSEELQPIHLQAQRFAPKIFYLKAHLRQILDEIQDRRLKGQLHDDRIREQINSKIHLCTRLASEAIQKNCNLLRFTVNLSNVCLKK
uniref:Uncharacterized protein n=1 Tax=Panagrolaimus sp. ES5 TaxID=591445 RepID=A0AC34FI30_9BILA